jgi:starvation-inducible DNA-binding protein
MAKNLVKIPKRNQSEIAFQTGIGIPEGNRHKLAALLNARLADALDFQTQAKFAHWNVKGNDFYQVHLLFDAVAGHAEEHIDLIAERITALGGTAFGTVRMSAQSSSLPEFEATGRGSMEYVRALAATLAKHGNAIREAIDKAEELEDIGTSDLFTQISRELDKDLYFLEAHLQDRAERQA